MLVCSLVSLLVKEHLLEEKSFGTFPKTAIIYVVRNEDATVLFNNLKSTFENNYKENVDLWLLSNSDFQEVKKEENRVIGDLQRIFGKERLGYFSTLCNFLRRKHVCVHEWLHAHEEYKYMMVCDADSVIPSGALEKLVRKGEHPDNSGVVLFQSQINVANKTTYFSGFLGSGQDFCQRIYARANQIVFARGVSYGSGCLIRCKDFREIKVPDWVLSHDIWDTIYLEERGRRVVFCSDVVTYGGFPNNYIDYVKRSERWIKGTLESFQTIIRKKIPVGTRVMVSYPIYMYCAQPIFFLWILSGFFQDVKMWKPLLVAQKYAFLGGSMVDLEMSSQLFITLGIIKLHRFVKCKTMKEIGMVFLDLFASLLLCLNNLVLDSLSVIKWLFVRQKGMAWVPTPKKITDAMGLIPVIKKLWPSTLMGVAGLVLGCLYSPVWTIIASPFLCSFILGIPLAYLTGKKQQGYVG